MNYGKHVLAAALWAVLAAPVCLAEEAPPPPVDQSYLADVCAAMRQPWPKNRIINIVCHGHSVPAGYFQTPKVDTFHAYPHLLHVGLKEKYPLAVINVIVTAIGGETSEGGAKRFEKDVLVFHPDVVLIDYGLNDRSIGLEKAAKALTFMIAKAKAQGAKVILLTPTADLASNLDDPKDPLSQQAALIRRLAKVYKVALVDSSAAFQKHVKDGGAMQDLMSQRNHPNEAGHKLVAEQLLRWF